MIKRASQLMKGDGTNKRGFSLLEIIVSLVILSTLAAGIFATVSFAKRVSIQAQQKAVAVSLIESRLSELKSKADELDPTKSVPDPFEVIVLTKCPGNTANTVYCVSISEFGGRMTGLVMVQIADNPPGYKEVLVVAKWTDFTLPGSGRIRTESAVTGIQVS